MISITRSMYMYEFEIKISHADFKADFGKTKHNKLKQLKKTNRVPNYFTYVAPVSAVPICIPDYAGLVQVEQVGNYGTDIELTWISKPKKLHDVKQTNESMNAMLRTLMFKFWNLSKKLNSNSIQRQLYK